MNLWKNTVMTVKGAALLGKLMSGQPLKITKAVSGTEEALVVDLRSQTDVSGEKHDLTLQPAKTEQGKTILPVLLENTALKEGYDLWQIGFYAEDPDEGEILYCLSQASKAKPIPSAAESPGFSINWEFSFQSSNDVPIEITLEPAGLVSLKEYQIHTKAIQHLEESIGHLDTETDNEFLKLTGTINEMKTTIQQLNSALATANQNIKSLQEKQTDTGWMTMPLSSGVTNAAVGHSLKYRKKNGVVYLKGCFKVTGKTANTQKLICTLPAGYRLTSGTYYYFLGGSTGHTMTRYIVSSTGTVNLEYTIRSSDGTEVLGDINWASIDISFPV